MLNTILQWSHEEGKKIWVDSERRDQRRNSKGKMKRETEKRRRKKEQGRLMV